MDKGFLHTGRSCYFLIAYAAADKSTSMMGPPHGRFPCPNPWEVSATPRASRLFAFFKQSVQWYSIVTIGSMELSFHF